MTRRKIILLSAVLAAALAVTAAIVIHFRDAGQTPGARAASASSSAAPLDCSDKWWDDGVELKGVVGGEKSRAYFDTWTASGEPKRISGILILPDERGSRPLADLPVGIEGQLSDDGCSAQLKYADPGGEGDVWQLRRDSATTFTGTLKTSDGKTKTVAFDIVPDTVCDGAGEWRTFSSPQWPMTFDYPANWVLTSDEDDVNIECPSLAALSTGGMALTFERGRFSSRSSDPTKDDEPSGTDPYWFVRNADGVWLVSDHNCAEADATIPCDLARKSERNGMMVLQGVAGEHRLYRPGRGYLGQGFEIARYLFVFGDEWLSLDDGANEYGVEKIGQKGGPVLLDGDSVGARVVRSVKLR